MSHTMNLRAPLMWEYISKHVDFYEKSVVDLGAGYCDLAIYAVGAGANLVDAVEGDTGVISKVTDKVSPLQQIRLINSTIEDYIKRPRDYGVAFCTSVLPYLDRPDDVLLWLSENINISIIECQYINDGPGSNLGIKDDAMMESWLRSFKQWDSKYGCRKIGETAIAIRPGNRSIWLCTQEYL